MQLKKPYTTPLKSYASKFLISTKKRYSKDRQDTPNKVPRFRTQADQPYSFEPITQLDLQRRPSVSAKHPKKQYSLPSKNPLKRESLALKMPSRGISLSHFNDKGHEVLPQRSQKELGKKPFFYKSVQNIKLKDLQCNITHLLKIFASLVKKSENRQMLQKIKGYVLEEESDLNQIQLCFSQEREQQTVKLLILNERLLLILLVQSLIRKRYRFNQYNFLQLFKDLFSFYSLLYFQLTGQSLLQLIPSEHGKLLEPLLSQANKFSLLSIKGSFNKKINLILKQFGDIDKFMAEQYSRLAFQPANLLYYRILQFYSSRLAGGDWSCWNIQFLETCPSPYIHFQTQFKYTLLLDLDQTLIHYKAVNSTHGQFLLRPYLLQFLRKIEPYYEVGIFTCALKVYADLILDHLPVISFRLYRQHAVKMGSELIKDLSRVGRDISKMILVDNLDKNFKLQKQNGIHVRSWYGDPHDNVLNVLGAQLQSLAKKSPEDLRKSSHKRTFL